MCYFPNSKILIYMQLPTFFQQPTQFLHILIQKKKKKKKKKKKTGNSKRNYL
ncbi:hypothetical protein Hanom_Chr17g01527451 [Helianthus anomalus]